MKSLIKFQDSLFYSHVLEWLAQITGFALITYFCITQDFLHQALYHGLRQYHEVTVTGIGLVKFQHRELGIMPWRQSFIAKTAVDLEYLFHSAHDQTLQIKLRRNTQIHLHIQCIVMGNERTCGGTTGDHLQHGCFYLDKSCVPEIVADKINRL